MEDKDHCVVFYNQENDARSLPRASAEPGQNELVVTPAPASQPNASLLVREETERTLWTPGSTHMRTQYHAIALAG